MDIGSMMDGLKAALRTQRSSYHVTLGQLIEALTDKPDTMPVYAGDREGVDGSIGDLMSYRGDYADLAFEPSGDTAPVGKVRALAQAALGGTFTGYKGGDYLMEADTPLWVSPWGEASGLAIIDILHTDDAVVLVMHQAD